MAAGEFPSLEGDRWTLRGGIRELTDASKLRYGVSPAITGCATSKG